MKYCQSFKENNDYNQMPLLGRFYQTEPSNFIKRLWHWCFPANFAKFLRTLFFIEHLRWLLLEIASFAYLNLFDSRIFLSNLRVL